MNAKPLQRFQYYNDLPAITFKEYGRSVQGIVDFIVEQEDIERRTQLCYTLIDLIKKIQPQLPTESQEDLQRIWDAFHIMSGFKLTVNGPFPAPEPSILDRKPRKVPYFKDTARFKHYGNNLELLIAKAIALEDPEEKQAAIIYLGRLMKNFYSAWNKDHIEDTVIVKQLYEMSKGQLQISLEEVQASNLFDSPKDQRPFVPSHHSDRMSGGSFERNHGGGGGGNHKFKKRKKR